MDLQLTTKAQEALSAAVPASTAAGHPHTEPAHLLKAPTEQSDTTTPALLQAAGSSVAAASQAAATALASMPSASGPSVSAPGLSRAAMGVLESARTLMAAMGDSFVSTDHLLLALAKSDQGLRFGVDAAAIEAAIPQLRGGRKVDSANPEGTFDALAKYGTDLTAQLVPLIAASPRAAEPGRGRRRRADT